MKPTYILLILGMLSLMGCASTPRDRSPYEEAIEELKAQLVEIDVSDGIDAFEARIIRDNYYMRFSFIDRGIRCGGPGSLKEEPDAWIIPVYVGYAAEYSGDIRIDKQSGTVSRNNYPTVMNPKAIWKAPPFRRDNSRR